MKQRLVIGVAGGSGSGKSFFVTEISKIIGPDKVSVLSEDSYYLDQSDKIREQRDKLNFDHPEAFEKELLKYHVQQLIDGKTIYAPVYDFTTHTRQSHTHKVLPKAVLIVEGLYVLYFHELCDLLDIKIFIDMDDDERFIRRLSRDIMERGRTMDSVIRQYRTTVKPMHAQYVSASRKNADLILSGDSDFKFIGKIMTFISSLR